MLKLFCVVRRALIMGLITVPALALLIAPHAIARVKIVNSYGEGYGI